MINLNLIAEQWEKATGNDISSNKIKLGSSNGFSILKAKDYMKEDPSGTLTALTLRLAFKQWSEESYLTVKDLLSGEWDKDKVEILKLKGMLFEGEINDLFNTFIDSIIKFCKSIGKEYNYENIINLPNIEEIISKTMSEFKNKYKIKHEKFSNGELKKNTDVLVSPKLFRFNYLKEFVDTMKQSKDNNFICCALIDKTYNINDNYSDNYDSFFAYGVKNNGVVYVISDRTIFNSPSGAFKSRNPGRDFYDKVDYSFLPYYKLDEIKNNSSNNQLLLTFNNNTQGTNFTDLFDDTGIVYTALMINLIYNKYFINVEDTSERLYFNEEVKFLPETTSKELILPDELQLPSMNKDIKYNDYKEKADDKHGIYNSGLFDWYIKKYPLPATVPMNINFIASKEDIDRLNWWNTRKAQKDYIESKLNENVRDKIANLEIWFNEQFKNNSSDIVNYMINTAEYDDRNNYNVSYFKDDTKELISNLYKENKEFDLSSLLETGISSYSDKRYKYIPNYRKDYSFETCLGTASVGRYGTCINVYLNDDNSNRFYELTLDIMNYTSLKKFFRLNQLPSELERYLNPHYCWKPYTGNSILDFTDPMNAINDPFNEMKFNIKLQLSKSMYNKICKMRGSKNEN